MKHSSTTRRPPATRPTPAWLLSFLLVALLLGRYQQAWAQFPRVESFQNGSATGFVLGGSAILTSGNADPANDGYLRLTTKSGNQSGFAIDASSFPAPNGFSISFEFFAYGGTGADGFSVFLVDADQTTAATFTPGASGGSLGYAQKTQSPISNGVPHGYIGIGIDEFGNYSNPTEGRVGGPGFTPDAVAIRGAGDGRSNTDYPYLTGSPTLPFSLDVPARAIEEGDDDYRRAYIDVIPVVVGGNTTYRITVRIQHGYAVQTAVRNFTVPRPPNNLRIGFSGSTGGQTNTHEIRNLAIQQAPFLADDVASTNYNQSVSIDLLNNDLFNYATYKPGSVDLNPRVAGPQQSLTTPQGVFEVTPEGIVTFTPSGTFAGVVTVPYTATDVLGVAGSPANITIIVRGADIANSVSGPTAAGPGAQVQYTVTTSNLGPLPATNAVPTLQLPAGLADVVVSSGTYDSGTGLVTFGPSDLASGGTPATNTVSFTAPTSGSVTGTTANTATEPDPVSANNIASIKTTISGLANVAGVCATPGNDGPGSLGLGAAPNTYFSGQSVTTSGNVSSIVLGAALTGTGAGTAPIAEGDLVLVMQMQGATLNTSNSAAYGGGGTGGNGNLSGTGDQFTAGKYEYAVATNSVPLGGGTLTLNRALTNTYDNLDYDAGSNPTGQRRFQVLRVPQYSALAVADSVAGASWNGSTGGVLALDVAGKTTFNSNAKLTMTGRGFRGGGGKQYSGASTTVYKNTDFRQLSSTSSTGSGGAKGEGTAGTPAYVYDNTAVVGTGLEGYRDGSNGRGAPGNAGGGGTDESPSDNSRNTGGGGGANGGAGGVGGYGLGYAGNISDNAQGIGGDVFPAAVGQLAMGGGGGAGSANNGGQASSGSVGGGIILLRTGTVTGPGLVQANGLNAQTAATDGGGGGGAGGTVLLLAANSASLSALTVSAHGGRGGDANPTGAAAYGPGGGGGGGVVLANGVVDGSSSAAKGLNGTTSTTGGNLAAFGATAGTDGSIAANAAASGSGTTACLPALTVAMSTSTPAVTRPGGSTGPVNPALYTLNIANTGGTATGVKILGSMNALFKYDGNYTPTVTLTMPDGSTSTPAGYTSPSSGTSTPEFGGFAIPAGATLALTFQATIDPTAQNGFAYQALATATYTDPLRTPDTDSDIQPGQPYADGTDTSLGAASGSNYNGSSTAEDVTIQAPLPVSLTAFTAVAVRLDAKLSWTTASEHNNDRFVVERSVDGTSFEAVQAVRGQGNSSKLTNYEVVDAGAGHRVAAGLPVYYRLRQVDFDGTSTYSPVRTVAFEAQGTATVYPNPSDAATTLDLSGLPADTYQVQVLDLTGRLVATYALAGAAQHPLALQSLASGTYVVRVRGGAVNQTLLMIRK